MGILGERTPPFSALGVRFGLRQLVSVRRVPVSVVILLSLAAIGVPWWLGTRHMDFMTSPTETELEAIREKTRMAVPGRARLFSTSREPEEKSPVIPEPIRKPPAIDPGDPTAPAGLVAYGEHAEEGADAFVELAVWLEEQGYGARALLAWERLLDMCHPTDDQRAAAAAAIRRLRSGAPEWNMDPQAAVPLVLEIVVPEKAVTDELKKQAEAIADELDALSSGLLAFETKLEAFPKGDSSKGIALRILGDSDGASSTGTFQLEQMPETPEGFAFHLFSGVFKLVAAQIAATTDFTPPEASPDGSDPRDALLERVTRLTWAEFGKSLAPADSN